MEPSAPLSHPPSPGTNTSPAAQGSPQSGASDEVLVSLGGHHWHVHKLVENQVRPCCVCQDALACRSLCAVLEHRVCHRCQQQILRSDNPACPLRCGPPDEPVARQARDLALCRLQSELLLRCAECNNWSGKPAEIDEHIRRCGEQEHPCLRAAEGCCWTGLLSDRAAHTRRCPRERVSCSLPECPAKIPRIEREEHEEFCAHQPASRGALQTTLATLWRLDTLNTFCQTHEACVSALPENVLRAQMQEVVFLVPLLCEVLERSVPLHQIERHDSDSESTVIGCPWGCGFHDRQDLLDEHYPHCSHLPVSCSLCLEKHPRRALPEHSRTRCINRPVVCERGCGQAGLRAQDISSGLHARSCSQTPVACRYCAQQVPSQQLQAHQNACIKRPIDCSWCLGSHHVCSDFQADIHCRQRIAQQLVCGEYSLRLHPQANGAVYVASAGADDPVFVRLPTAVMARELEGLAGRTNLTRALSFVWKGVNCQLRTHYHPAERCFKLRVTTFLAFARGQRAHVRLWGKDGSLLEKPGALAPADHSYCPGVMDFQERTTTDVHIMGINSVTRSSDEAVYLQLGPTFIDMLPVLKDGDSCGAHR